MRHQQEGTLPKNAAVVKTIVTTKFADRIARSYNVAVYDVLTGFKFIGEKIKEWESTGEHTFMFGYEESYGSLCGTHARDKDAVVASMIFAEMACYYTSVNVKLYDKLQELFEKFGYFIESSKSFSFPGLDGMQKMKEIMDKFKSTNLKEIGGYKTVSKMDLNVGTIEFADGSVKDAGLPKTNVIKYDLGNDEWVCIRPSGTEPKIKVYVSTCEKTQAESLKKNDIIQKAMQALM